jgi:predicted ATPase/class 3 adenylate cyclase
VTHRLSRLILEPETVTNSTPIDLPLILNLFGTFETRLHGQPLPRLRTRKGHSLLALLALRAGREAERAWLAGTLWPDNNDALARNSLRTCLADLRRALGREAGRLSSPGPRSLALDLTGAAVDVLAFDAAILQGDLPSLEQAVSLYRGPLLEGCAEEWVFQERSCREQSYLQGLERLARHAVSTGDAEAAERWLRRVVATDPLRETAQRQLMAVLADAGNYTAAAEVYRELRLRLHRETNSEPDAETTAQFNALREAVKHGRSSSFWRKRETSEDAKEASGDKDPDLPAATLTFFLTDIEGSTRLWLQYPDAMGLALARHDELLTACIEVHGGAVLKRRGEGDSAFAVFSRATDAVAAAAALQRALVAEPWPAALVLRVRIALHTGEAQSREGDYYGPAVNHAARLRAVGHGGQTLLSPSTAALVRDALPTGVSLRELGIHRLKDLQRAEPLFQLVQPELPADFPPLRSLESSIHNLPVSLTSFIGRERDIAAVKQLLPTTHLLTLTGAGGCGKTRLALQVAAELLGAYADGVWLVELAALAEGSLVPRVVATALGLREEPGRALLATLSDALRGRSLLLLLDNCEHLLPACAQLAEALLRACPRLRILASSREALGIGGERTYRVPSLSLPEVRPLPPLETLQGFEAVRLFVERAVWSHASFALSEANALAVVQVCERLDGIPLAIELAAARVKTLPVEEIHARLDDRFRLLTGGSRTALPRQQTLRALIDWSHDLLSEPEQTLLRRLSLFAGGWTLAAAEAVCGDAGGEVLDPLTALIEKSLVVYEERGGEARYRLLETIRHYAREKLVEAGEAERLGLRHRDYYLLLAEEADPHLYRAGLPGWQKRLEREHDNLRAALRWSLGNDEGAEAALRMVGALAQFWLISSHLCEGLDWVTRTLERGLSASPEMRARAMLAGWNCAYHCDRVLAGLLAAEALQLAREAGDRWQSAWALFAVALEAIDRGELETAHAHAEEGMGMAHAEGDYWLIGRHQVALGLIACMYSDYAAARACFHDSLEISRELGDEWHVGMALACLAPATRREGECAEARVLHQEGIPLFERLGDRRGVGWHLVGMAGVEAEQGRAERAARLLGAAAAALEAVRSSLPPFLQQEQNYTRAQTAATLGEGAFAAAWAAGRALPLEEAIRYAMEEPGADG